MFPCMKPGCPADCGTRTRPSCTVQVFSWVLFLGLAAVLAGSLMEGLRSFE